jgi:hypothetical protein
MMQLENANDLDECQSRIERGLAYFVSPGIAEWFSDACRIMNPIDNDDPSVRFKTASHIVAHLLREIEGALGKVLKGSSAAPAVEAENRLDLLERQIRAVFEDDGEIDRDVAARIVPVVVDVAARWLSQEEPRTDHIRQVRGILHALKISEDDPAGRIWVGFVQSSFAKRAHRNGLDRPRPVDAQFRDVWEDFQMMLDHVLDRVAVTFLPIVERVRALALEAQPTRAHRQRLLQEFPQEETVVLREFFAYATPGWLDMLVQQGMFVAPPATELANRDSWSPGLYLMRVAEERAKLVSKVIAGIRTDNPVVHDQLLAAALAMPPVHAARVVPAAKHWVEQPFRLFESRPFGHLVAHLAHGGHAAEAADLARSVLGVVEPAGSGATPEAQEMSRWMRGPQSRIGTSDYAEVLSEDLPVLAEGDAGRTLVLLCDLLAEAVGVKNEPRPFRVALEEVDGRDARPWGLVPDGSRAVGWRRGRRRRCGPARGRAPPSHRTDG